MTRAVERVIDETQPVLLGHEANDQRLVDQALIDLDQTPDSPSSAQAAGMSTGIGDQGGFALDLEHNRAALDLIVEAIGKAGFTPGQDIALAIDAAASELYAVGAYNFEGTS